MRPLFLVLLPAAVSALLAPSSLSSITRAQRPGTATGEAAAVRRRKATLSAAKDDYVDMLAQRKISLDAAPTADAERTPTLALELAAARREAAKDRLAVIRRLNTIAYINAFVLAFVALGVAYELFHVDVEAIVALYKYALPVDDVAAFRFATSVDLLAHLPTDLIRAYEALVPTNPVFYKACTSGVAYTLGDFVSQVYQGRTLKTVDLARSARSGAAGFVGHGPLCHYWMVWMEANLDFGGAWYGTGAKVLADQTVWSLYLNACYSFLIGTFALRDPRVVWQEVKATSWPALRSSWRFWPFVHTISFSHLVPLDLKLLWVDAMEIVWVTILSKVANDDKEANLAANPEAEVLEVVEQFGTDPSLEIELTREFELDGSLDLEHEKDFDERRLAFELPKNEVLKAAWPLAVMWPVIFGTFQLEKAFA